MTGVQTCALPIFKGAADVKVFAHQSGRQVLGGEALLGKPEREGGEQRLNCFHEVVFRCLLRRSELVVQVTFLALAPMGKRFGAHRRSIVKAVNHSLATRFAHDNRGGAGPMELSSARSLRLRRFALNNSNCGSLKKS